MIKVLISLALLFAVPNFVYPMQSGPQSNTYRKKLSDISYAFKSVVDFSFRRDDSSALVVTCEGKVLLVDFSIRTDGLLDPKTVTRSKVMHDFDKGIHAAKIDPEHRCIFLQFAGDPASMYLYKLEDNSLKEIEKLKSLAWDNRWNGMIFSKKSDKKLAIYTGVIGSTKDFVVSNEIYFLLDLEDIDKISISELHEISDIAREKQDMSFAVQVTSNFIFGIDSDFAIFSLEGLEGYLELGILNFEDLQNVQYKKFSRYEPKALSNDFIICETDDKKLILVDQHDNVIPRVCTKSSRIISSMSLSPDKKMAASTSRYDKILELWDLSDINNIRSQLVDLSNLGDRGGLYDSEFDLTGRLIITRYRSCFYFYDTQTKKFKIIKECSIWFEFSPRGEFIYYRDLLDLNMVKIIDLSVVLNDDSIPWKDAVHK